MKLSGNEWVQLVPFVVTTSVVVYLVVSALLPSKPPKKPDEDWVNKSIQKDKEKVADIIEIEDLGDKTVYCRCWKSKKVRTPLRALHAAQIGKISLTSPIVIINVLIRASLSVETKGFLFLWLAYLNNKSNVCKQISSL